MWHLFKFKSFTRPADFEGIVKFKGTVFVTESKGFSLVRDFEGIVKFKGTVFVTESKGFSLVRGFEGIVLGMFMGSVLKMFDGIVLVIKFSRIVHYLFFHKDVGAKVIGPFVKVMALDLLSSELYFFCTKGLMHESFFVPVHICVFLFLPGRQVGSVISDLKSW